MSKMKKIEVTRDNIQSFLKTRKGSKYYFKFPGMKKTLICEEAGILSYTIHDKEYVLDEAFKAYKEKIK